MAKKRVKIPKRPGKSPKKNSAAQQQEMLKQLNQLQEQMMEAQNKISEQEFTATSGGGAVEAMVTGDLMVRDIKIDPDVVDEDDVEMLEDLVIAAIKEAQRQASQASEANTEALTGGLGANLDLGNLTGGLGNLPGI